VCGGLAEYFGVDTVLVRIAALVLLFAGGAGFFLYLIGWIAIPEAPETLVPGGAAAATPRPTGERERTGGAVALGLLFVAVGVYFLLDKAFPDLLAWQWIWPIALIVIGAAVILRARQ
jgi:phage shock protein PspC (stress-responsive transcriptional regulator)